MSKQMRLAALLFFGLALLCAPVLGEDDAGDCSPSSGGLYPGPERAAGMAKRLNQLPLHFVENQGQINEQVSYYVQGRDKTLYFTPQGVTFVLNGASGAETEGPERADPSHRWVIKLDFVTADPDVQPVGLGETGALINYFKGLPEQWKVGLKTYSAVVYRDLWPGIDLQYSGSVNRLKYQFIVHPGADPVLIRLAYRGATEVSVDEAGQLEVTTPLGNFHDDRPYAYQESPGGEQIGVEVSYVFPRASRESHVYGFHVGPYDRARALVIDPAVLVYCGYIGGSAGYESGQDIAVDGLGHAYVTGYTESGEASFPVAVGPDLSYGGSRDAFVAKVRADGTGLVYCGYIGGDGIDDGYGIAVDAQGNAYIAGRTGSDEGTFPVIDGPDLTYNGGSYDAFVAKVITDGSALAYCGYIGGEQPEEALDIALDGFGNAYVTGFTGSTENQGFPVVGGPDLTHNGMVLDVFVAKVITDGSALDYCGYIGGLQDEHGRGIAVDAAGNAYVAGWVQSSELFQFPVLVGPDLTHNGNYDAFVAKVITDGTSLAYCGYVGGSKVDVIHDIAVDDLGNAYLTGLTDSSESTFPVVAGPDLTLDGGTDAFVAKVITDGSSLAYCGYIGGDYSDVGEAIAVDGLRNAYVTGSTNSTADSFPVTIGPDLTHNGNSDAFVARVISDGTALDYCGYIGGGSLDVGYGIAVDGVHNAYVTGDTTSTEATFPATVGPDLTYNDGTNDAFVASVFRNRTPELGTVTPSSGTGPVGVSTFFTTTWSDTDGWQDLKQCYFHIGADPSLAGNVTLQYNARKGKLWLRTDDGSAWSGGYAPGSASMMQNSQAIVHCSLITAQASGDTLRVRWAIEFRAAYTGAKKTGLRCKDVCRARAKAQWKGTWTIQ